MASLTVARSRTRATRRLAAWILWGVIVAAVAVGLVTWIAFGFPAPPIRFVAAGGGPATVPVSMFYSLVFGTTGLLLATHRPRNSIGWMFLVIGLAMAFTDVANRFIGAAITAGNVQPAHALAAWVISSFHLPYLGSLLVAFLVVYPHGRVSRTWGPIGLLIAVSAVGFSLAAAVRPGQLFWYPDVRNPFGAAPELSPLVEFVGFIGLVAGIAAVTLATLRIYRRYVAATGDEQLQYKWIAYAGLLLAVASVPYIVLLYAVRDTYVIGLLIPICILVATLLPLATAFAVLKYRLYDIDVIFNRTLVYLCLTAILAGAFAALATLMQRISVALTGNESDAALILTTLIVAILVEPVRRVIETLVDERFKPSKTGPTTVEHSGVAIADGVALAQISGQLRELEAALRTLAGRIDRLENGLPKAPSGRPPQRALTRTKRSPRK